MIPHDLFPIALRHAKPEQQLEYLLQRRTAIEKLLRSLEHYAQQRNATPGQNTPVERTRGSNGHGASPHAL